jgi:CRP/FNR family transcriptional regulator
MAVELRCRANYIIFSESKHVRFVYFITSGVVRRYRSLRDGRRHIIGFALPGDFIVVPQFDGKPFSADAIGDVCVSKISRKNSWILRGQSSG